MPVLKPEGYRSWLEREQPSAAAEAVAARFILRSSWEPWAAPSIVVEDMSERPRYEYRAALLPVAGEPDVQIYYRHYYGTGDVVVREVSNR